MPERDHAVQPPHIPSEHDGQPTESMAQKASRLGLKLTGEPKPKRGLGIEINPPLLPLETTLDPQD